MSTDTDCLRLIEYKQARYPDDRRRIVAAETSSDGNVRVLWVEKDKLVAATFGSRTSNATAAIARSGYPIAEKLITRMKREVRGKVVNHWNDFVFEGYVNSGRKPSISPAFPTFPRAGRTLW